MRDNQKEIDEMATRLHGFACGGKCHNKTCLCSDFFRAEKLVNANYGNIPQALTEFAEKLKATLMRDTDNLYPNHVKGRYSTITSLVDETLKEFLPNANIS